MKSLWKPIIIILVAGIMAADVILDQRTGAQAEAVTPGGSDSDLPVGTRVGQLAPDFTGSTLQGQNIRLSDLRGKTVLLNVFASWCGPCQLEMPHLVQLSNEFDPGEVIFVGLNLQENPEAVSAFRDEFGIDFPLILNEDGSLTNGLYTPVGLPTSWFIDREGVVRYRFYCAMTGEALETILDDVIAGREPDPFDI